MTFTLMQKVGIQIQFILNINKNCIKLNMKMFFVVPLHILYSYDDSSSDDDRIDHSTKRTVQPQKPLFHSTNRTLNKMPPVHKIHKITSKHTHTKSVSNFELA